MIDTLKLNQSIQSSGLQKKFIAEKLELSRQSFSSKLHGKTEFRLQEVSVLCDLLNISPQLRDDIFFPERNAINAR